MVEEVVGVDVLPVAITYASEMLFPLQQTRRRIVKSNAMLIVTCLSTSKIFSMIYEIIARTMPIIRYVAIPIATGTIIIIPTTASIVRACDSSTEGVTVAGVVYSNTETALFSRPYVYKS